MLSGDIDKIGRTINVASATMGTVNCSAVPPSYCSSVYKRQQCMAVKNTCGECLAGYSGKPGNLNEVCVDTSINALSFEERLHAHSSSIDFSPLDLARHREFRMESMASKACPSSCSSNGNCKFLDSSGNVLSSCLMSNVHCFPICYCKRGKSINNRNLYKNTT